MNNEEELHRDSGANGNESKRRKIRTPSDQVTVGDAVDRLSERDWRILIDLYFCRCLPQKTVIDTFFLDNPGDYYEGYSEAPPEIKAKLDEKNRRRALIRSRRNMWELYLMNLVDSTSVIPNEIDKPSSMRRRVRGEPWYYLTSRGLSIVEVKIGVLEEAKLSKHKLDMERIKKDHFWELGKVYLDLRYKYMAAVGAKQFLDWDWHPALTVHGDKNKSVELRPDAVLRLQDQVFYIELDRSTEPIQRSPFVSEQNSIVAKLKRYREVIHLSKEFPLQQRGIIAFIVPDAIYETRMKNILAASRTVWPNDPKRVIVGRTIGDLFEQRLKAAGRGKGNFFG